MVKKGMTILFLSKMPFQFLFIISSPIKWNNRQFAEKGGLFRDETARSQILLRAYFPRAF